MRPIDRGEGRTTKQMKEAPQGAVFVWVNHVLHYPKVLAQHLGRKDLQILGPDFLNEGHLLGRDLAKLEIVVDHALWMTAEQLRGYERYLDAKRRARKEVA